MQYVYTAILEPEGTQYNVTFPDLPGCLTCGDDLGEALYMAEDALNLWLVDMEESGEAIPAPSAMVAVPDGCRATLVRADTDAYRKKISTACVRKNVSMPAWLAHLAEERGVNFSQVLQEALKQQLGIAPQG